MEAYAGTTANGRGSLGQYRAELTRLHDGTVLSYLSSHNAEATSVHPQTLSQKPGARMGRTVDITIPPGR